MLQQRGQRLLWHQGGKHRQAQLGIGHGEAGAVPRIPQEPAHGRGGRLVSELPVRQRHGAVDRWDERLLDPAEVMDQLAVAKGGIARRPQAEGDALVQRDVAPGIEPSHEQHVAVAVRGGEHFEPRLGPRAVPDVEGPDPAVVEHPAHGAAEALGVEVVPAGIERVGGEQGRAVQPVGELGPQAHGLAERHGPAVVDGMRVRPGQGVEVGVEAFVALALDDPLPVDLAFQILVAEDERGVFEAACEPHAPDPFPVLMEVRGADLDQAAESREAGGRTGERLIEGGGKGVVHLAEQLVHRIVGAVGKRRRDVGQGSGGDPVGLGGPTRGAAGRGGRRNRHPLGLEGVPLVIHLPRKQIWNRVGEVVQAVQSGNGGAWSGFFHGLRTREGGQGPGRPNIPPFPQGVGTPHPATFLDAEGEGGPVELEPGRGAGEMAVVDGGVHTQDRTVAHGQGQGAQVVRFRIGEMSAAEGLGPHFIAGWGVGQPLEALLVEVVDPKVPSGRNGPGSQRVPPVGAVAAEDEARSVG